MCNGKIKFCEYSNHLKACYQFHKEGSLIKLPDPESFMKFKNHKNKLERPFIVYADTECTLEKVFDRTGKPDKNKMHRHVVNSCCYYFVCTYDSSKNKMWYSTDPDCLEQMIKSLFQLSFDCIEEMKINQDMVMTQEDKDVFYNAKKCCVCGECFKADKDKVRDHDHRTGKFRGAAHNKCNINYFNNRYLPIVFHNLRGYDSHLIIKKAYDIVEKNNSKPQFKVIPNSYEKFMSFDIGSLKFIDSFQFMASSLESLVENLKDETNSNFHCLKAEFPDHHKILCQKGLSI